MPTRCPTKLLVRRLNGDVRVPAMCTIHAVLDRHGLVRRISKRRNRATGTPLSQGVTPNDLWCADYKSEFRVTDHESRFVLLCEGMQTTREELALTAFERLFAERGMPLAIRSDKSVRQPNGLFNLSKLSVWWLRLEIQIERLKLGHPQQNGRHERIISHSRKRLPSRRG